MRRPSWRQCGERSRIGRESLGHGARAGRSDRPPGAGALSPAYCIPASSAVKDEAWELLAYLISPEEMAKDTF